VGDEVRSMIIQRKDGGTIKRAAAESGMIPLRYDGVRKVLQGITTIE
jgi:general secretion pathway protein E